ncbi:MAG: MarR family transcriptional regulator [Bacteroidales bacterium]|nr:MarR family transcriptional regulator [Bacteroidales bacterium]MBR1960655.1 MarR family transcriptional regulator [Bacteroidales bacterium]
MNESLKLENQLCFPLYACAKEIVRRYTPLLEPLGLTYTQYIAMMVMWEHKSISVRDMGKLLFLDSGTLTPMLKKMEKAGWIQRKRSERDERMVILTITARGEELHDKAAEIPSKMARCVTLENDEALQLYSLLNKMMKSF